MLWIYNIAIQLYNLAVHLYAPFNKKAALFVQGRKGIFKRLEILADSEKRHIWFHFASLGEFEQGRPVLEALKSQYPEKPVIITFFSPSGYEIRKNYPLAEAVCYLPLDTASNAHRFVKAIHPEIAIFTKYEYWYHYFDTLHRKEIPIFIISGIFRPNQVYFKWYGGFNRSILRRVQHFFLQNEESKQLLSGLGLHNTSISGDTRFDRVAGSLANPGSFENIRRFCKDAPVLVAGSTWPADEELLVTLAQRHPDWKFIIAPHETDISRVKALRRQFPDSTCYTEMKDKVPATQTLIIDTIGILSSVYQYGKIAYIGGGFGAGIHNTLEAAAFGLPVLFGPRYEKFQEAKDLIAAGAALSIKNAEELEAAFSKLQSNESPGKNAARYVASHTGATAHILSYLSKKISH
ncbi:glycosyltransferase N-terminal domain-containing protein [Pedobacter sp. JY14-1]|uniref:3-deoxy-D-manno-octulosonic acid transferase n=1 Tax=Pedobacter sp. JY14-1 TaxID=3034151 RepID=UPI0023E0EA63|nr:glycosyltransferase N-terminal domain-containing protein [Pedobacter sp. JY14-1]